MIRTFHTKRDGALYKRMHGLKAHNRSPIRVDIYDLDSEPPPFPVEYSRQPTQGATQ